MKGKPVDDWSPLGSVSDLLAEPVITTLAQRYEKTPGQIVLRWHMELGLVAIPRSSSPERLRANIDIFDFALSAEAVDSISAVDRGESAATDSDTSGH